MPYIARTNYSNRRNGSGAVVIYQRKTLKFRLADLNLIKRYGQTHIQDIVLARSGNATAIERLKRKKTNPIPEDDYGNLTLGIDSCGRPFPTLFPMKLIRAKNLDRIKATADNAVDENRCIAYYKVAHEDRQYNHAFGVPHTFKDEASAFILDTYFAVAWQLFIRLKAEYKGREAMPDNLKEAFVFLFKYHEIRSILDVGCGNGRFFRMILPLCEEAGIKLFGIDLLVKAFPADLVNKVEFQKGDARYINGLFGGQKFDVIVISGVLGEVQIKIAEEKRESAFTAYAKSFAIAKSCVEALSDNSAGGVFIQSFQSFLLLDRAALEQSKVDVLYWNTDEMHSREETDNNVLRRFVERRYSTIQGIRQLEQFWETGANIAVMVKAPEKRYLLNIIRTDE